MQETPEQRRARRRAEWSSGVQRHGAPASADLLTAFAAAEVRYLLAASTGR